MTEQTPRPSPLLTQNARMREIGVRNWTIPALGARLPDGRTIATCPNAGVCARVCYARNGTYLFPAVQERHTANLRYVLEDPDGWEAAMVAEVGRRRMTTVRIHDAGDFFSDDYLAAWLRIIEASPGVFFYAYSKEVSRIKRLALPAALPNFRWVFSLGGLEDHLLTEDDRIADVFPNEAAIHTAGWHSQKQSDLLAVTGPAPVGMAANNIPKFKRLQGERTLGEWQASIPRRTNK